MPSNLILNSRGDVTGIVDWGSACWGESARDLAGFRTSFLPTIVESYRAARGAGADDGDSELEAGALRYQLFVALSKLVGRPATSELRNWSAPRAARFVELMRFFTSELPDRWRPLMA